MKKLSDYFKALSDDTRLKIIQLLTEYEMCVCEIEDRLGMSQPAVSHHIGILKNTGLISGRRQGKWIYYSINGKQFMDNHNNFKQLALFAIEDRVTKGLPVSPILEDEDSYCKMKENSKKMYDQNQF